MENKNKNLKDECFYFYVARLYVIINVVIVYSKQIAMSIQFNIFTKKKKINKK